MWRKFFLLRLCLLAVAAFFILISQAAFAQNDKQTDEKSAQKKIWKDNDPEFRAAWITRFSWPSKEPDKTKANIIKTFEDLQNANFNVAVFQIRGEASVLYPSKIEPWSPLIGGKDPGFDPLELAISEAHKRGIKFHAYINPMPLCSVRKDSFPPEHSTPEHLYYTHGPDSPDPWVCYDADGKIMDGKAAEYFYLSPNLPAVQEYLRNVITDIVKRYDVDGIHLDRIRFPGPEYSHDAVSVKRFYTSGNPNRLEWADWQREQLDKFINDLAAEIAAIKPKVVLSCAAWGIYNRHNIEGYGKFSSGYHDYYQDTWEWVRLGAMDLLMPMIYWNIPDPKPNYNELIDDFSNGVGAEHIIGGQKLYRGDDENIAEIKYSREAGNPGTVIFSYSERLNDSLFPKLKESVYKERVPVPEFKWKTEPEYGIILGKVVDETGAPVEDAWVSISSASKERRGSEGRVFRQVWTSGMDGRFAFLKVPKESVTVSAEYFGESAYESCSLAPGEVRELTITIKGAQKLKDGVFFTVFSPTQNSEIEASVVNILGRTLPENKIQINGEDVQVFSTGAFAKDGIALDSGVNKIAIKASTADGSKSTTRELIVNRKPKIDKQKKETTAIEIIEPSSDRAFLPGDMLEIKLKAPSGFEGFAYCFNDNLKIPITEILDGETTPTGIYYSSVRIPANVRSKPSQISIVLKSIERKGLFKKTLKDTTKSMIEIWNPLRIRVGEVTEDGAAISYGTHSVRLGGPYFSEVQKGARFEIIGKEGKRYKIKISETLSGWIGEDNVKMLPKSAEVPHEFFTSCSVGGNDNFDVLTIPIDEKILYTITPQPESSPSLKIDVYYTHFATTWITHKSGAKVIGAVTIEQVENDHVRINVPIKSKQIWGYWTEYKNGALFVYIKRPPKIAEAPDSPLKGLTVAIEAGHGGSGTGAVGTMGTNEKTINAKAVAAVSKVLKEKGASIVVMREGDSNPSLKDRTDIAKNANADFLLTIHANAAGSPRGFLRVSGTSVYCRYEHNFLPAKLIYDELLKLGWNEFGVVNNFYYYPLRNTKVPAALVEQAFMDNPYDEARLLSDEYQKQQADAIVKGIENFLNLVRE